MTGGLCWEWTINVYSDSSFFISHQILLFLLCITTYIQTTNPKYIFKFLLNFNFCWFWQNSRLLSETLLSAWQLGPWVRCRRENSEEMSSSQRTEIMINNDKFQLIWLFAIFHFSDISSLCNLGFNRRFQNSVQ